jgi:hypothetical protein
MLRNKIRIESRIQAEIEKLLVLAEGYSLSSDSAHRIEKGLFKQLLQLGKTLLLYIFNARIRQLKAQGAPLYCGISLRYKGDECPNYLSLFGLLAIERPSFEIPLPNGEVKTLKDVEVKQGRTTRLEVVI